MKFLKILVRKILNWIDPDLEYKMVDQYHFNRHKRRPPDLMWEPVVPNPEARLDVGRGQIGQELFIFGGFRWDSSVVNKVDIFDMETEKWSASIDLPEDMAHTHLGVAGDGERYTYLISGQIGGRCLPATKNCFVFDARTRSFNKFPPLPLARYAPAVQLWRGRLHSIAGAKEDRNTPATEHWSIAVKEGKAFEQEWREEPPIPRGGHHRASAVIGDALHVLGGQEGDYIAIPGDPECRCTGKLTTEIRFADCFRLKAGAKSWERVADMPVLASHTESSVIQIDDRVLILGGDCHRVANVSLITLNDEIQLYDAPSGSWRVIGRLPFRIKSIAAGYYRGHVYFTTGQRDKGPDDATPMRRFERGTWKVRLDAEIIESLIASYSAVKR